MNCNPAGSSAQGILQARTLEWVTIPFSRGSSQPRDQTQISCIAGRFFTVWATREAPMDNEATQIEMLNSGAEKGLFISGPCELNRVVPA